MEMNTGNYERSVSAPITPPSTVKKETKFVAHEKVKPRRLFRSVSSKSKYRPKPNTCLELDSGLGKPSESKNLDLLAHVLQNSQQMVMITGAGISTHAGIQDFRSQNGLYRTSTSMKSLFDYNQVYSNEQTTANFNKLMVDIYEKSNNADPTPFHLLIDKINRQGRLRRVYTQNIDSIEWKLLSDLKNSSKLVQLHGTILKTKCNKCQKIEDFETQLFPVSADSSLPLIPNCKQCEEFEMVRSVAGLRSKGVGKIRPMITLYNEPYHENSDTLAKIINHDLKYNKIDCLLIVGTTLSIQSVKTLAVNFTKLIKSKGRKGYVIFISNEMPSDNLLKLFKDGIDLIVLGDCQKLYNFL
ncbi:hypothetical protein KAFR_0B06160 [Kazachstania africana CBS 2517]|uniref:Deacetylase sirtuin-type domain-containing protein n=1 Tax=Kazachstania africana (strain ATCC 22294 / BCRC 22015 / CBS 2517 / CECT 1963 / NBRC 1671 / NRRL Y-8276) TaxID=1071382 RepID=H2ARB2_KAZAF|nr:hypothetical protein KAFR_0B06160 [Kazachstania africana CBS 2517]CCF56912.1 hypothetical protein KAFR_0B06160 [Kazachstania africana CBS 2517]